MTRNNADFQGYQTAYRFSHKSKRESIEALGLKMSPKNRDYVHEPGDIPRGVYGYEHEDSYKEAASGYPNTDLYEFKIHPNLVNEDPWLPDDAIYSSRAIPKPRVKRIGHVTAEGELHMHPEEHCDAQK